MKTTYYTLLVKDSKSDNWSIAFGDYDLNCVKDEKEDSYSDCYKTKIIKTADDQTSINAAVALLNN